MSAAFDSAEIRDRLFRLRQEIRDAAVRSARAEDSVRLMAVSKFHPQQAVLDAVQAGQLLFGENRVQEAVLKFPPVFEQHGNIELHIIGGLQSNKVRRAVQVASCIQSVDRMELLPLIEKYAAAYEKQVSVFFEIHTAEDSKSGFRTEDDLRLALSGFCETLYPHVVPVGFMTMAPFTDDESAVRGSFIKARTIAARMRSEFGLPLNELSMGMSGDFKIAIEEGSTMVRIGTAIFGERQY